MSALNAAQRSGVKCVLHAAARSIVSTPRFISLVVRSRIQYRRDLDSLSLLDLDGRGAVVDAGVAQFGQIFRPEVVMKELVQVEEATAEVHAAEVPPAGEAEHADGDQRRGTEPRAQRLEGARWPNTTRDHGRRQRQQRLQRADVLIVERRERGQGRHAGMSLAKSAERRKGGVQQNAALSAEA